MCFWQENYSNVQVFTMVQQRMQEMCTSKYGPGPFIPARLKEEIAKNVKLSWARLFFVFGKGEPETKLFSTIKSGALDLKDIRQPLAIRDFVSSEIVADQLHAIVSYQLVGEMDVGTGRGFRVKDIFEFYKKGGAQIPAFFEASDQSERCFIANISWQSETNYKIHEAEVTSAFQAFFFESVSSPKP